MTADFGLTFNGHDIGGFDGVTVTDWSGLFAGGARKSPTEAEDLPGDDGGDPDEVPFSQFTIPIPIVVGGDTIGEMFSYLRPLAAALYGTNGLGPLVRTYPIGTTPTVETASRGQFVAYNTFSLIGASGRTELNFINWNGFWLADDGVTKVVP